MAHPKITGIFPLLNLTPLTRINKLGQMPHIRSRNDHLISFISLPDRLSR